MQPMTPHLTLRHMAALSLLALASCASSTGSVRAEPVPSPPATIPSALPLQGFYPIDEEEGPLDWERGQALLQGFFGVTSFDRVSVDGGVAEPVDGDEGELDELPFIGGGGQWKLGGDRVDIGLEGLLSFAGRANAEAFVIGGGGAAIAIDVDLLIFEMYGGPFASVLLGENLRLYAAAGPLIQFADYEPADIDESESGSGFGTGYYARAGIEIVLPSRTLLGVGVRWSDSTVELNHGFGDLDMEGLQAMITVSRGL